MPGDMTYDQTERIALRKECYLKKKRGIDRKFKEDFMPKDMALLLTKWPKFLDLQMKLPEPPDTVALEEMRKMCPGKPATLEEIEEISKETPFYTPFWKGRTTDTDIPARRLEPAEVDVINRKYLELKAAFDAKRASQSPTESINRAEDTLVQLGVANQEQTNSGIRRLEAQNQQILDTLQSKGKGKGNQVEVDRRADVCSGDDDGEEDVLVRPKKRLLGKTTYVEPPAKRAKMDFIREVPGRVGGLLVRTGRGAVGAGRDAVQRIRNNPLQALMLLASVASALLPKEPPAVTCVFKRK